MIAQENLWGKSEHHRASVLDNVKLGWPKEKGNRDIPPTDQKVKGKGGKVG